MKPLVSVIVPVYNVEPWLERCLDSLAGQTMKEIEIIVVDDGSPDRCGEICDAYAVKDSRFRVVHQENRGLSAARNVGIELAQADYLMFVDSDDWVDPEFCRLPYEAAVEHGAELVVFQYHKIKKEDDAVSGAYRPEGVISADEAMQKLSNITNYMWNKLYRMSLFREIRFPEGRYFEDMVVMPRIIHVSNRVYLMNSPLYYYCVRNGSISSQRNEKFVLDYYEMKMQSIREMENWGYDALAQKQREMLSLFYLMAKGRRGVYSKECISCCRSISAGANQSMKSRILLLLFRYAPPLFDLVCVLFGKRIK